MIFDRKRRSSDKDNPSNPDIYRSKSDTFAFNALLYTLYVKRISPVV